MDLTKASRFISLILRHKPWVAGIDLDEHGWADVEELIQGVRKKYPLDRQILEEIVRTDNKQRYSFNDDKTKIRANQGHSIAVDVELPVVTPPEILYHGTGEKYAAAIEREGLVPKSRLYVHLSGDVTTAENVGRRHGRPVIFCVHSGDMHRKGHVFYRSVNGVWLTKRVEPQFLRPYSSEEG